MTTARARFGLIDLFNEAVAGVVDRPGRSLLTGIGTVLGVGTLLAVLGLTATATAQIGHEFDLLRATEVHATDGRPDGASTPVFTADAEERVRHLNGVTGAGVSWTPERAGPVNGTTPDDSGGQALPVVAATPGLFTAAGVSLTQGRVFDTFAQSHALPVAVIGAGIANRLKIPDLALNPSISIGGRWFSVVGIMDAAERMPSLLLSVVVPDATAEAMWGPPAGASSGVDMLVTTRIGAAIQISSEAALALRPDQPDAVAVAQPPDPRGLKAAVDQQLELLLVVLGAVSLIVGAVGIANTTLVAVLERTAEIGLRRAVGARGRHIVAQFVAESGMIGLLSGLVGTAIGVTTVLVVSWGRGWDPVLPGTLVGLAPVAGLIIGVLAGLQPALNASRIAPVDALRR